MGFRTAAGDLNHFMFYGTDPNGGTGGRLDDIYVDSTGANLFNPLASLVPLVWDGDPDGNWGELPARWIPEGGGAARVPDLSSNARIESNTVTVTDHAAAQSLEVTGGALNIAATKSLTIAKTLTMAPGVPLGMGDGAVLDVG